MSLAPHHQAQLSSSAITPEIQRERGYRTIVDTEEWAKRDGHMADYQVRLPGIAIPIYQLGQPYTLVLRPDNPRIPTGKTKPIKYEWPRGLALCLDLLPRYRDVLRDCAIPIWFTEGAKKADALTSLGQSILPISINGVWGWRSKNADGNSRPLTDFDALALKGRTVILAFDSDLQSNPKVLRALTAFAGFLAKRGARVGLLYLPDGEHKLGVDDAIAAGFTYQQLLEHVRWGDLDISGRKRTLELWEQWEAVLGDEGAQLIWTDDGDAYIQLEDATVLALESDAAALWFQERAQRDAAYGSESFKRAAGALRSIARQHGAVARVFQRSHTDFTAGLAYIGIDDAREMYRISADAITIAPNGTDGVLLIGGAAPYIDAVTRTGELARWFTEDVWADDVSRLTLALYAVMLAMGTARDYSARPLLQAQGVKGSGKTTTLAMLGEVIVGKSRCQYQGIKKDETNEARLVTEHLAIFDNVDQPPRGVDFEDFLATASTSEALTLRKLYSNAEVMRKPFSAFVAITSFTMPRVLKRSDILDRALIIRFKKNGKTKERDARAINRNALWSDLLVLAQQVVANWQQTPRESDLRSIPFVRIAHALAGAQTATALEQEHLKRQSGTAALDDLVAQALLQEVPAGEYTATDLLKMWREHWDEKDVPNGSRALGRMLAEREGAFGQWLISRRTDRTGVSQWSFMEVADRAGLADELASITLRDLGLPNHVCRVAGLFCNEKLADEKTQEGNGSEGEEEDLTENNPATLHSASQSDELCSVSPETPQPNPARIPIEQRLFVTEMLPKRGPEWARDHMAKVARLSGLENGFAAWPVGIRLMVQKAEQQENAS